MDFRPGDTERSSIIDRGWTLRLGPLYLHRWTRVYKGHDLTVKWPTRPLRTSLNGRVASMISGICMLGLVTISLAAERVGARSAYKLMIAVPPAPLQTDVAAIAPQSSRKIGVVRAVGRAPPPMSIATRIPLVLSLSGDDATTLPNSLSTEADALKAALASGDMQEWTDPVLSVHGFVVAGPLRQEADRQCRDVSVMTRSVTAGDAVEQRQACMN